MELFLRNGLVFLEGTLKKKNLLLRKGKIAGFSRPKRFKGQEIDCTGLWVLPGMIDSHVHFREPGMRHKEDWKTGSSAAAKGGITTVLEMPNTAPPTVTVKELKKKRRIAGKKSMVNYGFYFGAAPENLDQIELAKNIAAVKVFMGSSTGDLLISYDVELAEVFSVGKKLKKIVSVHAEDEGMISHYSEIARRKKLSHARHHGKIRREDAAEEAIGKAIGIKKLIGNRLHFHHVTSKGEMELIKKAKKKLKGITCEVTPNHLFLNESLTKKLFNFVKMNPPLRGRKDQEVLWKAVRDGTVDVIGTDHAPHLKKEKKRSYWKAPSGVPGIETMLSLLLTQVSKRKVSLNKVVALCSENPAKLFGIKGKGFIKKGFDADLALVDPKKKWIVSNRSLFTKCGWSPFEGWLLKGSVEKTIVNGKVVFSGGKVKGKAGKEVLFK